MVYGRYNELVNGLWVDDSFIDMEVCKKTSKELWFIV